MRVRPIRELRVGFVTGNFAGPGPAHATLDALGRLISELHRRCRSLDAALSVFETPRDFFRHPLPMDSDKFRLHPLPEMTSFARGLVHGPACRRTIREIERLTDVLIVQLPFSPPQALLRARKPRLYQVCADCVGVVRASRFYRGWKRFAAVSTALAVDRLQGRLFRRPHTRVVTNGSQLFEHYGRPPGRAVVSASLLAAEVGGVGRLRPDGAPPRILYLGYFRPEKGTDTLLEAFRRVRNRIPAAELHLVGMQDLEAGGARRELDAAIAAIGDPDVVRLRGFIPFGRELFQTYADADVLVLPSRSEGTPRVLNEARAFGCPVVATRIGGIPDSVEDEVDGLLVPPDDPERLAAAMLRLLEDGVLRQRIVAAGRARMGERTIERFVDVLAEEVERAAAS